MQTPSNMILLPQGARSCRIKTREERSCESKFRQHNVGVTGAQGWQNKYHISHLEISYITLFTKYKLSNYEKWSC